VSKCIITHMEGYSMAEKPKSQIVRVSALLPRDLHRKLRRAAFENGLSGNRILKDALEA